MIPAVERLDINTVVRVIKMELLIGTVHPVTERSFSQCLCRAVSMAWSISSKCGAFHENVHTGK
jgi:hypothetical protein